MHNKSAFMHIQDMKVKETPLKPSYMYNSIHQNFFN